MDSALRRLMRRPSTVVAPEMLGWRLVCDREEGRVVVELTEVEAYAGPADPASHAFRGPTARNQVMFGPAGRLYVYLSYGIHWCANVVTGPVGEASAVLLRAGRVVEGSALAGRRRGAGVPERFLARGPACLTSALGITRSDNGADLLVGGFLRLEKGDRAPSEVVSGPRVGVGSAADVAWRFWVPGDVTVSSYRRSKHAGPVGGQENPSLR